MFKKHYLHEWLRSGLLSKSQVAEILDYESQKNSGRFLNGLIGVGLVAILFGILSLVAANWHSIPSNIKLSLHILLSVTTAAAVYIWDRREAVMYKECALLASFGLTLTLIALIGQVFQLHGSVLGALAFWLVLTTPMILAYGDTRLTQIPWFVAFVGILIYKTFDLILTGATPQTSLFILALTSIAAPSLFLLLGLGLGRLNRMRLQHYMQTFAIFLIVLLPIFFATLWYDHELRDFMTALAPNSYLLLTFLVCSIAGLVMISRHISGVFPVLCIGAALLSAAPLFYSTLDSRSFAILSFVCHCLLLGYAGQKYDMHRLVQIALLLFVIRIYVAYIELFGSLLLTGFGLIVSGIALIGGVWSLRKMNQYLKVRRGGIS